MALITLKGGSKYFGEECLFESLDFHIDEGERVGLVGVNGAGKTSLFKVLTGEMSLDSGNLFIAPTLKMGYMRQNIEYDSDKTIWEEVMAEFSSLLDIEKELDEIRLELEKGSIDTESRIKRQDYLMQCYEREGGFEYKSRAKGALIGLGFKEADFERKFKSLSGGEKTRLLLCRLLLGKYDMLLLDEPTNHLDMSSIEWLEGFLKAYKGSFIVISHDRYFLDKTTNKTLGMSHGKITSYTGSYSDFIKKKDADDAARAKKYDLQKKEIKRLEGIIEQQKRWGREKNIKTAESKQKMIDRIAESMESPEEAEKAIRFSFNVKEGGANEVLTAEHINKAFGAKKLLSDAEMKIMKGERVFLIGDNGCGKTTLLKMILGQEAADYGVIRIGNGISIGYYEQQHMSLDPYKTVYDTLSDEYPFMDRTEIRSALAAFLFRGEDCFKEISSLSGGEKARVLLSKIMLSEANFLILDEPTNHLDIFSKEALEDALRSYEGTILAVSHDRYFINSTADKIYKMENGQLTCYNGNYDYCLEKTREQKLSAEAVEVKGGGLDYKKQKELAASIRKAENLISKTEAEIAECEAKIEELTNLMFSEEGNDADKALLWHNEKTELEERLSELYEIWEKAEEELSKLKN